MRKLKITILALVITLNLALPSFAMSDSELENAIDGAKSSVLSSIDMTARRAVSQNYPVGTVYATVNKNIDEDYLYERFGGAWREINHTFLWATGSGKTGIPAINIGERGGNDRYVLYAGIGIDENGNYAFYTSGDHAYNPSAILEGNEATLGDLTASIPVIDEDATYERTDPFNTTIMPPYTVVKMYENISNEFDNMPAGSLDNTRNESASNLGIYFFAKPPALVLKNGYKAAELSEPESTDNSEDAEQYRNGMRYKVVRS